MLKHIKFTACMGVVMILCMPNNYAMDVRYRVKSTPQNVTLSITKKHVTPIALLAKPWVQRMLIYISMIANACRCCQGEDDIDIDVMEQISSLQIPHGPAPVQDHAPVSRQVPSAGAQHVSAISLSEIFRDDASIEQYYGKSKLILEDSFAKAPQKARNVVNILNHPELHAEVTGMRLLYGGSGAGKSTLARAIAYTAGWFIEVIYGADVRGEHRGSTSIKLQRNLKSIIAQRRNTIIIIEEMNRFFENYNDSRYDTGDTAEDFWTFLDRHSKNPRLFIIGTMNRIDKLPTQIQSRARLAWIELSNIQTTEQKAQQFMRMCTTSKYALDPAVTVQDIEGILADVGSSIEPRDFEGIVAEAVEIARETDLLSVPICLTKDHVQTVINRIKANDKAVKYGTVDKPEEQARHEESLKQQRELHNETTKMQKEHFVKGLVIQKAMQSNQLGASGSLNVNLGVISGTGSTSVNNISRYDTCLTDNLSDEDIQYYREQKQITEQRKNGQAKVKSEFSNLAARIRVWRQKLVAVNSSSSQSLIVTIDGLVQQIKQLYGDFKSIQIPSQEEAGNFSLKISKINEAMDGIKAKVEELVGPVDLADRRTGFGLRSLFLPWSS